VVLVVALLL